MIRDITNWLITGEMKAFAIALLGLAIYGLCARKSAATKHAIATAALFGCLVIPFTSSIHPSQTLKEIVTVPISLAKRMVPWHPTPSTAFRSESRSLAASSVPESNVDWLLQVGRVVVEGPVFVCAVVSAVFLLRIAMSLLACERLRRSSRPYVGDRFGAPYPVIVSDSVDTALAVGVFNRQIVLPGEASGWSEFQRRVAILHEQEHLKRFDVLWMRLGLVARALLWVNPLVWWLSMLQVRTAEEATDNRVLTLGMDAPTYAQALLDLASGTRNQRLPLALGAAMVRKSGLRQRVRWILAARKRRGFVEPFTLTFALIIFAGVAVAGHGMGVRLPIRFLGGGQPPANLADLENAGTPGNEFATKAEDGRPVQLVQVQRWTPSGIQAWKPDGTPVPANERISESFTRHDPKELHFFTKFESASKPEGINGGLGSGVLSEPGGPHMEIFMGGYIRAIDPRSPNTRMAVSFIQVPDIGRSGLESYRFGMTDQTWTHLYTMTRVDSQWQTQVDDQAVTKDGSPIKFAVTMPARGTAKVFLRDAKGDGIPDGKGGDKQVEVPATNIQLTFSTSLLGQVELVPHAYGVDGKPLDWIANHPSQEGATYHYRFSYREPIPEIGSIQIDTRSALHADFLHVHLRPNGDRRP